MSLCMSRLGTVRVTILRMGLFFPIRNGYLVRGPFVFYGNAYEVNAPFSIHDTLYTVRPLYPFRIRYMV